MKYDTFPQYTMLLCLVKVTLINTNWKKTTHQINGPGTHPASVLWQDYEDTNLFGGLLVAPVAVPP